MKKLFKHILFVLNFIFGVTAVHSQETVKIEFNNAIHDFKQMMESDNYELILHQNTYLYDLDHPFEANSQYIIKNSDYFYYQSNEITVMSFTDYTIVVDSLVKTIYLTDNIDNPQPMNFLFGDSILNKVSIEKKELKDYLIFNIDMYGLNRGIESAQYHFEKKSKMLKKVIIFFKEDQYYEDENHLNEKQAPIQEIVIQKMNSKTANLPSKNDFILKRKNEYVVSPKFNKYILKDIREK